MRKSIFSAALLASGLALSPPASAQKSADTLRITWRDAIPNIDPFYNQLRSGIILAHQAWDTLIYRDPETFQNKPLLAESYKWIDDTTLEFALRQNVTWHNGDKFTADDVVYTINTVIADKQVAVPSNYSFYESAEKVDDYHVRVKLKRVFPAALDYMAMTLWIWPKAYREKVGVDEYARHPIGTGPYKFSRIDGVTQIDLERYDGYYADSPKGRPAIRKVVIHQVPDSATEMAELLGGRADWIWKYSPDQFENVNRMPTLQALRSESMRIGYVNLDSAGRTGAGNPLTNPKVRQAIFHAIDRDTMAKQLVQGGSRALDAPCFPTQFGCDAGAAVHYAYDPAKAKQLLAEAGYPNGFDTELVTYILPSWAGAMQNYLKVVGINVRLSVLQVGAVIQRSIAGQNPMEAGDWGSYSINDVSAILPQYFGGGGNDYTRDTEIGDLVKAGGSTTDPDQRRKSYSAAIKLITERANWLPLYTYTITYGLSRQLNFKPYPDELPRFYLASWK
ncbi:MAG: ABC transporter substrate-binding protein [Rhodospirillales bacterium]